ncbi:uncharacterized protein LOC106012749 [Aplysia californica]|uniref:Uncharacterized protein LOC106012749 n=1 Tax=Aplysia californica TaxID=6500 RepID=A0ABM1A6Y4_APLCA|nr:uncharacterized protein LOC106012749 [Aplysia californica]
MKCDCWRDLTSEMSLSTDPEQVFRVINAISAGDVLKSYRYPRRTNKPAYKIGSYRPISLTSYMYLAKLVETLVKARLMYFLESNTLLSNNQSGFRKLRSTEDQVLCLTQHISDGFQARPKMQQTLLPLVDFSRAFDKV